MMRRQHGFSLMAAIFLIVVLAMLGLFAVKIATGQQQTADLNLLGSRALSAAKAGMEWGAYRALHDSCAGDTFTLDEGALSGFSVVVRCTDSSNIPPTPPLIEHGREIHVYELSSVATFGVYGQPGYVSRQVQGSFTDAP